MEDLSIAMKLSPDSMKYLTEARSPPCDLGGARLHTYFRRRSPPAPSPSPHLALTLRRVGAEDSYIFSEIFSPRYWHHFELPAAASIILEKVSRPPTYLLLSPSPGQEKAHHLANSPPESLRSEEHHRVPAALEARLRGAG
jgi:hypothetical protein